MVAQDLTCRDPRERAVGPVPVTVVVLPAARRAGLDPVTWRRCDGIGRGSLSTS
jgi:hypothetical protein